MYLRISGHWSWRPYTRQEFWKAGTCKQSQSFTLIGKSKRICSTILTLRMSFRQWSSAHRLLPPWVHGAAGRPSSKHLHCSTGSLLIHLFLSFAGVRWRVSGHCQSAWPGAGAPPGHCWWSEFHPQAEGAPLFEYLERYLVQWLRILGHYTSLGRKWPHELVHTGYSHPPSRRSVGVWGSVWHPHSSGGCGGWPVPAVLNMTCVSVPSKKDQSLTKNKRQHLEDPPIYVCNCQQQCWIER